MQNRLIFHIDVNSAFLSWESIYRLKQNPSDQDLRMIASAVGGDQSSRRGVVLAKSTAAKQFGIITGEPLTEALRKCPHLTIVPPRFEWYTEQSRHLIDLLSQYTPTIEKFSIDEAFLDMTETIHLFASPEKTADQIRTLIYSQLGFSVNIGISSNKILAKMASDFQKPNLCHTLFPDEIRKKMWPLSVGSLFFVGSKAQEKLALLGIHTIGELASSDPELLKAHLGNKYTTLIYNYANGIDHSPVAEEEPEYKGYGNSTTLPYDVHDYETAQLVLLSLSETLGARLRADKVVCSCICVELKDWQFQTHTHQTTLPAPTASTAVIYQYSCQILQAFWDLTPIRLIGIRTSKLSDPEYDQISLFDHQKNNKLQTLERAIDDIRYRYGTDSIKRASFLQIDSVVDHASGKSKHLSPASPTSSDSFATKK